MIGQQLAEKLPEIVAAAAGAFRNVDNLTVLNGAQGMSEILDQVIGQAGPTLALAKQALGAGSNGSGTAPTEPPRAAPETPPLRRSRPARRTAPRSSRQASFVVSRGMRAAILREYGQVPEVGEHREPEGDGVVEVLAAAMNPVDVRIASGSFPSERRELPYVAGKEGVGRRADGSLVYFDANVEPFGAFAPLAQPAGGYDVPDGLDPALAVSLGVSGLAAWLPLTWRAQLREGESVLVMAASGVLGQIAVQAAKLLGAGRVVAAARSEDGLQRAAALGADATVAIGDDFAERLREAAGDAGFDVVLDPLWGEPAAAAIAALRPFGRLVQVGPVRVAGGHPHLDRDPRPPRRHPRLHELRGARRSPPGRLRGDGRARRGRPDRRRRRALRARRRAGGLGAPGDLPAREARHRAVAVEARGADGALTHFLRWSCQPAPQSNTRPAESAPSRMKG